MKNIKNILLITTFFFVVSVGIQISTNGVTFETNTVSAVAPGGGDGGCCGGGEGGDQPTDDPTGGDDPTPGEGGIQPICTAASATKTTVSAGESTEINFSSNLNHNDSGVDIRLNPGNIQYTGAGSFIVNPTSDTTYTVTVSNNAGQVNCPSVAVEIEEPTPAPTCLLTPSVGSPVAPGTAVRIDIVMRFADQGTLHRNVGGQSVQEITIDASTNSSLTTTQRTFTINEKTTFDLDVWNFDANGDAQTSDCKVTIDVEEPPVSVCTDSAASNTGQPLPCVYPPQVCTDANATNTGQPLPCIYPPQVCTDSAASNTGQPLPCVYPPQVCTDANATNTGQPLPCIYPPQVCTDSAASNTGQPLPCVYPPQVCTDANANNTGQPLPCTYTNPSLSCSDLSFTADDTSVRRGSNVELSWVFTGNVTSATVNQGIGLVNSGDKETVTVNNTTTYTTTISNGTESRDCDLTITATTGGGGGSNSPSCRYFEVSDEEVRAGEQVTLSWKTRRTEEITLYEGTMRTGDELFNTDDEDIVDEGTFKVRPTEDTTYTLHLEHGSRDRTCKVEVEVDDEGNVVVLSNRTQEPRVAGIALTAVPYTGFEAGPTLTIIFYILLALWGLFVTYSFVIKRDSILGFSLVGALPRKQSVIDASAEVETESEEEVNAVAAYVASATADAPANLPTGNAPVIGYAAAQTMETEEMTEENNDSDVADVSDLENRAHTQNALLSSDAIRYFADSYAPEEQFAALDAVITDAKRSYPSEDGWVVINLERMQSLMNVTEVVADSSIITTEAGSGSLAEAIVTGNVAAALTLLGSRPMLALADATADLDALYRLRTGGDAQVSDLLASSTAALADNQIKAAISALTSALDGTYADEREAAKTAVMKAIKTVS